MFVSKAIMNTDKSIWHEDSHNLSSLIYNILIMVKLKDVQRLYLDLIH